MATQLTAGDPGRRAIVHQKQGDSTICSGQRLESHGLNGLNACVATRQEAGIYSACCRACRQGRRSRAARRSRLVSIGDLHVRLGYANRCSDEEPHLVGGVTAEPLREGSVVELTVCADVVVLVTDPEQPHSRS